jgi:hypothetical protein
LNCDEMNELESEESSPNPEPFHLFVIPESHERGGLLTKVRRPIQRWKRLRIVTLGFGTGRQKMILERWTNPKSQTFAVYVYM